VGSFSIFAYHRSQRSPPGSCLGVKKLGRGGLASGKSQRGITRVRRCAHIKEIGKRLEQRVGRIAQIPRTLTGRGWIWFARKTVDAADDFGLIGAVTSPRSGAVISGRDPFMSPIDPRSSPVLTQVIAKGAARVYRLRENYKKPIIAALRFGTKRLRSLQGKSPWLQRASGPLQSALQPLQRAR